MTTQDTISTNGKGSVEQLTVLFRSPVEGTKWLRGLPVDATDTDYVNMAVALGAVSWVTLGTVELPIGGTVTDCDYIDGAIVSRRVWTAVAS